MLWLSLIAPALAGIPTFGLAEAECALQSHRVTVSCKKGVCLVEEQLAYFKPDCEGTVSIAAEGEVVEPILRWGESWVLPAPCEGGQVCVEGVGNRAVIRRVLPLREGGGEHGLAFGPSKHAEITLRGGGLAVSEGPAGWQAVDSGSLKKAPKLKPLKEAADARSPSRTYGGPIQKGYRHGLWLASDPAGHPRVREIRYERGLRVEVGEWQARTLVDASGRVIRVDELDHCPVTASVETSMGALLTQSCTWSDDDGSHAVVASFQTEPWQIQSVERVLNGKRSGQSLYYGDGGVLERKQHFAGDKLLGESEIWWANGALRERVQYAPGEVPVSRESYDERGRLVSRLRTDVPGVGGNPYEVQYDPYGARLSERVPVDAVTAEVRTWKDGVMSSEVAVREWTPPETGCAADLDCTTTKKEMVGLCDAGVCRVVPDLALQLKGMTATPLRDGAPLEAKLAEAIGTGRTAWASPDLIGSGHHSCVEVSLQADSWLEHGPRLTGRAEVKESQEQGETVRRWTRLNLDGGGLVVEPLAAAVTDQKLEPRPSAPVRPGTLALSEVTAKGAMYGLTRYDLEAICTPHRTYVPCKEEGAKECNGEMLMYREPSANQPRPLVDARPEMVLACEAACPTSTCDVEASRLGWMLSQRSFQRPERHGYALWWAQSDCERALGR